MNSKSIHIRNAKEGDVSAILGLINELAIFEKAPDEVAVTEADLLRDGFGQDPYYQAFVAESNNEVIGMALCYIGYSTWKGKLLYLDDLVVTPSFRNKGAGTQLLARVIDYAAAIEAKVIKWQALRWNKDAIRFYQRYDVSLDDEWVDCKMFSPAIEKHKLKHESI